MEKKTIKIGVADYGMNVWYGGLYDIEARLAFLKEIGFDGTERLEAISESDAIHKAVRYRKMGMDFATCRGPSVQAGLEWTAALGKEYVWLTPGELGRTIPMDVWLRRAKDFTDAAAGFGLRTGLHNHLMHRIENQAELDEALATVPNMDLLFDVGHLVAAGGDPVATIHRYANRLVAVHMKDVWIKNAEIGLDRWFERGQFCELDAGNVGFNARDVLKALKEVNFQGWIHVEHDTHVTDVKTELKKSYDIIREVFA